MKVFALLFFVGCAFASQSEWRWQTGKQHVFEYSGRLLTGLPQMASHYSGIGINATILIDALSPNKLQLSVENPRFAKVNQRLEARMNSQDGLDGQNWREVFLPEMSEVSSEYKQLLEQPIIFELVQGEIREAKISRDEPEWSVNFKKALALLFQTKFDAASWQPEENQITTSYSDNFWKTKEESMDGICEVTYQINELPKYMIRDRPELIPYPEECRGQKYYEVTKSKNIDNCEKRSAFSFYKPGFFKCNGPNCKNMWSRTAETRVIACGTRGNLMIQSIVNQGQLNQNLLGIKTEEFMSGNLQVLRLREIRSASPKPEPRDVVQIRNMMFEYSYKSYQSQAQEQEEELEHARVPKQVLREPEMLGKILPSSRLHGQKSPLPKPEIMRQIKTLMQSVIREMTQPQTQNLSEKQITMKILSVARGLSMLKKSDYVTLYEELRQEFASDEIHKSIAKNLFYDTALMSATPEAIRFIKEQMLKKEMTKLELFSLFVWMPNNLIVPSHDILEEIYELVTSPVITECKMSRNVATMSFTTLLEKACLARNRRTAFPSWVMGEFCNPESSILKEKWIPYLLKDLEQSQDWQRKNDIIVALGMLPSQELVGKLVPLLENQHSVPKMSRFLTLWSLSNIAVDQPEIIEPIYFAIYSNPAEATEMRISAFNALLKLNPTVTTLHKIAARTWTEQDMEVLRAVNTAFETLASEAYIQVVNENINVMNLAKKLRLVYPLIKKVPSGILFVSASVFGADFLPKLDVGYESIQQWIMSKKSFLPKDVYWQLTYFLSQYQFNFLQTGYHLEGIENVYRRAAELLVPAGEREQVARELEQNINSQWRQLVQKLNIKPRDEDEDKVSGAGFFRVQEAAPVFGNFHEMTIETLKEKLEAFFGASTQSLKEKLNKDHRMVFKRTVDVSPYEGMVATDMGFPLIIEFHYPIMVSIDSKFNLKSLLPRPQLTVESRVFYTAQYVGWVGTMIPFTKEWATTVLDQTKVLNLPATIKVDMDLQNQALKMSLEMDKEMQREIDLVHHHVHPFTAIQKVEDFTPITLAADKKMIKSRDELKEVKKVFGEEMGVHMVSQIRSETRYIDMRSIVERLSIFNYNPVNFYMFSWADFGMNGQGQTSLRRHEYTLRIDPTQSATKGLTMDFKLGFANKVQGSQQIKYHKIKMLSAAEQEERAREEHQSIVVKQLKKLVPLGLESQPVENKSLHPQRQQKLEQLLKEVEPSSVQTSESSAQALTIKVSTTINGARPQTYSYSASAVRLAQAKSSQRKLQTKWHLELESQQTQNKIVLKGDLEAPVLPVWDVHAIRASMVDYRAFSTLQYFQSGSKQWNVDLEAKAQRSSQQKEFSQKSPEAKLCQKLKAEQQSGQEVTLAKLSPACQAEREQARALDEVDITVKYNNVPRWMEMVETKTTEIFKTVMWPYMKIDYDQPRSSYNHLKNRNVFARIQFNQWTPSFDLTVQRSNEKMVFRQIRLPYPLNWMLPLKADVNNVKLAAQKASAHAMFPVCKVETKAMQTFDNRTLPLAIDSCYHLMAADCTKAPQFGVLARKVNNEQEKEIQVFLGKSEIIVKPQSQGLKVIVDGQEHQVRAEQWQELRSASRQVLGQIIKSQNQVIQISAPQYSVALTFDGQDLAIETDQFVKGQMCGLCGNQNSQSKDEIQGPQQCMYSKPEVEAAAYRIENHPQGCDQQKPLAQHIKQKLDQENRQCVKREVIATKISKSLKTQAGPCTILKHAVIRQPGQICISKKAVTQCAAGCEPSHIPLLEKKIPFTCLKEDRVAEHYVKKAERGERLIELEARTTSFETKVPQPRSCVPASNEL